MASHDAFEDFRVKGSVRINDVTLQPIQSVLVNRKTKHIPKTLPHLAHVQTTSDVGVGAPAQQSLTVLLRIRRHVLRSEALVAFGTAVVPRYKTSNPLFHSTFDELQIKQVVAYWLAFVDISTSAPGTCPSFSAVHFVDANDGPAKLPVLFVNSLEVGVRAYKNPLTLVIEIRALGDLLKIFQSVLFRSK